MKTSSKREIVVGSGAAESVCPWDFATKFLTKVADGWSTTARRRCECAAARGKVEFRNMVQFGPTDEDNNIFCPRKDRKFVLCHELRRGGVGFQKSRLERADASTAREHGFPRVGNHCAHKDVRPNEFWMDVLGAMETRSTRERGSLGRGQRQTSTKKEEEEPKRIDKSEEGGRMRNIGDTESPSRTGR